MRVKRTMKTVNKERKRRKQRRRSYTRRYKYKGGSNAGSNVKVFNFYNRFHLGDNILNLKFFFNISGVLKDNSITINYYYDNTYPSNKKEELERFVNNETMKLHPLKDKAEGAIDLWMGLPIDGVNATVLDTYYNKFYENILKVMGLDGKNINTSLYQPEPYLQEIYNNLDNKYKDLDILVINAAPQSKQYSFNQEAMNNMCIALHEKYNIVTTSPVNDVIKCTMNDKLMLKDIGAISTHVKYIVGVHSGPVTACFNSDTNNNIKKWILFANNGTKHVDSKFIILDDNYDLKKIEEHLK